MVGWFGKAAVAATGLCLIASSVPAQFPPIGDPNKDEAKCEAGAGKTLAKFVGSKGKCITKCIGTARKTMGPYGGCFAPYADPTTNLCITDPLKGAEAKARAGIAKGCSKDCPECYTGTQCTDGEPFVTETEGDIDAPFGPGTGFPDLIYCKEKAGTTPTKDEGKCEDGVIKALSKFVGSKSKCYAKCKANELKGKIALGGCEPPPPGSNPTDPATNACINDPIKGAAAKAKAAIIKACPIAPSCYSGGGTGAANTFVAAVESKIDSRVTEIACGSPSGAFLQ